MLTDADGEARLRAAGVELPAVVVQDPRGVLVTVAARVYDTTDPYSVEEGAYYVPGAPQLSPAGAIQLNDVYVDDRRIVYTVDRFAGGLYILEMTV